VLTPSKQSHIVPPTGAKGLNLAASDVHYLWQGLAAHYCQGSGGSPVDAHPQGASPYIARLGHIAQCRGPQWSDLKQ
jgi:hypothetical protein